MSFTCLFNGCMVYIMFYSIRVVVVFIYREHMHRKYRQTNISSYYLIYSFLSNCLYCSL